MSGKLLGGMMLLAAGTALGCLRAERYAAEVRRIRLLRALVSAMVTALRGTLPLVSELLRETAAMPQFQPLRFLQDAARHADCFPACWAEALSRDNTLTEPERAVMETVGQTLGSTALEGQVAALSLCAEQLAALSAEAEPAAKQKGTLCRSMGVLGSIFLVILLL